MNENIDAITANEIIQKTLKEYYEKEIETVGNNTDLEKVFGKKNKALGEVVLKELSSSAKNFTNWVSTTNAILDAMNSLDKVTNETVKELDDALVDLEKNKIVAVDTFEVDLKKEGIDVSEWEESIKPVKVIMSVITRNSDGEFGLSMTIGNLVMLMEDGTFRMNQ